MTDTEREEYEERAAIMEFDGRLPRAQAERDARRMMLCATSTIERNR
jgi:hypothetical protein